MTVNNHHGKPTPAAPRRTGPAREIVTALRTAAAAVSRVPSKNAAAARQISLATGRLQNAAHRIEGARHAAWMRSRTSGRMVDQTATQDALAQMDQGFDSLDAILAAIGPVRQQLDDSRTLIRNLIASSLETDSQVKAAVAGGAKAHATTVTGGRPRQQRIVIRPSALLKRGAR